MTQRILTRRERTILYLTGCVIIFALVFNFLLSPVLQRFDALNRQINSVRGRLYKYMRLLSQKDYIEAAYAKYSVLSPAGAQKESQAAGPLAELENLANGAGIRIIDLRPRGVNRNVSGYNETQIEMRTQGPIESYFNFIYGLETSLYLLKIKTFQLSVRPNTPELEGMFTITQFSPSAKQ